MPSIDGLSFLRVPPRQTAAGQRPSVTEEIV
jgi:hypothetical protein